MAVQAPHRLRYYRMVCGCLLYEPPPAAKAASTRSSQRMRSSTSPGTRLRSCEVHGPSRVRAFGDDEVDTTSRYEAGVQPEEEVVLREPHSGIESCARLSPSTGLGRIVDGDEAFDVMHGSSFACQIHISSWRAVSSSSMMLGCHDVVIFSCSSRPSVSPARIRAPPSRYRTMSVRYSNSSLGSRFDPTT